MSPRRIIDRLPAPTAIAVYLVFIAASGMLPSGLHAGAIGFAAFCISTGIAEEAVFCGVIYKLLAKAGATNRMHSPLRAAALTATLFGLAHLSFALGPAIAALKVLQAALFSFCMLSLYRLAKNLWVPMLAHAAFDAWYFLAPWRATGALPAYPAAVSPDANMALLAGTTLFFAIVALIMYGFVFRRKGTAQ